MPAAHATISASESAALRAHLNQGRLEEQQGNYDQARAAYSQVLAVHPEHPEAHHRLGVIADKLQQYDTAQRHYQIALRGTPNDPVLLSDMGYSLLLQQRFDESERTLLRAASVSQPPYRKALLNLGLLHATRGDYDRALATFRQVGTEEQAQARMQALFPNGRPQGNPSLAGTPNAMPNAAHGDGSAHPELAQLFEDMRQERIRAQQNRAERDPASPADPAVAAAPPFPEVGAPVAQATSTAPIAPPLDGSASQPPSTPQGDPRRVPTNRLNELFAAIDAHDPNAGASGNSPAGAVPQINATAAVPIAAPVPQSLPVGVAADPLDSMETWPPESSEVSPWATSQNTPSANDFSAPPASGTSQPMAVQPTGLAPPVQPVGHVTPAVHDPANYAATVVGMDIGFGGLFPLLQSTPRRPVTAAVQRFPGTQM
ncbi:MAG: tetratricopeptide repeat protein, partial [Planctomycetaceae bacterium]